MSDSKDTETGLMKVLGTCVQVLPLASVAVFLIAMGAALFQAHKENVSYMSYVERNSEVKAVAPGTEPLLTQESIDMAMELYSIRKPVNAQWPTLDMHLEERGLTAGGTVGQERFITIGPAAFTSWGMLGSTLGHELEIHANQSFIGVYVTDRMQHLSLSARKLAGNVISSLTPTAKEVFELGTWKAEREAYEYELASVKRFQLKKYESQSISQVMNLYYPKAIQLPVTMSAKSEEKHN